MGKHVHERVDIEIDSSQLSGNLDEMSDEERLAALVDALEDEGIEYSVDTSSEIIN